MRKGILSFGFAFLLLLSLSPTVTLADNSATNQGRITFEGEYGWDVADPESPYDFIDPGPGDQVGKSLRIEHVPNLYFGEQQINGNEATYYAYAQNFYSNTDARGNFVQVSDYRGGGGQGWTLSLKQEQQFHHTEDENIELLGANLFFDKSWANSRFNYDAPALQTDIIHVNPGSSYIVAEASPSTGEGCWAISFGASSADASSIDSTLVETEHSDPNYDDKPVFLNTAVGLIVPQTANVRAGNYTTELTWTLSELP